MTMQERIQQVREEREGFTLAELLIVVAIIMVLVAIAIPVFTGALDKANKAVEAADMRAVKSAGATQILLNNDLSEGPWMVTATVENDGDITNLSVTTTTAAGEDEASKQDDGSYDVTVYITATDLTPSSGSNNG